MGLANTDQCDCRFGTASRRIVIENHTHFPRIFALAQIAGAPTGHRSVVEPNFPLSMTEEGSTVRVVALRGGPDTNRRLTEMGLHVGSELTVRQKQGSGLVVMRGHARFALGSGLAHRVWVERVGGIGHGDVPADCALQSEHTVKDHR